MGWHYQNVTPACCNIRRGDSDGNGELVPPRYEPGSEGGKVANPSSLRLSLQFLP